MVCLSCVILLLPKLSYAICATVKIEIQQELALERQAFDAHMRINNTLSSIPIEDVGVTVNFVDEAGDPVVASSDPNDSSAVFFIRIDTMDNIEDVSGAGSVAPETSADIHWLIIPSPGASNGLQSGTLYYVGAELTYTVSGQSETIEVSPDYIFVKPMPQLVLDYFLPTDVYGDDAHTPAIEPAIPFSLGLRVSNKGDGYAQSLRIESAQPKIVDNALGLLIGFQIEGSMVNGLPATESLLVDFGHVAPQSAGTARWTMSCSLSGRFIAFGAEFSHADALGGQLTSLIAEEDVNTHVLVRDVLVDAEGRDDIKDFLALDEDIYRVYESDNTETVVTNQSAAAALVPQSTNTYQLVTPPTSGFIYAQLTDPHNGTMVIKHVIRSDGKQIKPANTWLSKTRTGTGPWQHFVNIFDDNTPGIYTVVFQSTADVPQAPVIAHIPERTRVEGVQLSFLVEATDPNGTVPGISAQSLPIGATFIDQGDGTGIFNWTPTGGQAGRYAVKFVATDGLLTSSRQAIITVLSADDTDGDDMLDSWETEHFGALDRDGTGDFDGDGISDLDEYLNGFDPTTPDSVPTIPEIVSPQSGDHVSQRSPDLEILNSIDPENDPFTYTFEVYADKEFTQLIASAGDAAPQSGTTIWTVPVTLEDNTHYYWRTKALDNTGSSNWAYGHFFINTQNDPPTPPAISYPTEGTTVDSLTPALEASNSSDPDEDELTYTFEIYTDSSMTELVTAVDGIAAGDNESTTWVVNPPLTDDSIYYWRPIAVDGAGVQVPGPLSSFRVDTLNSVPGVPTINTPAAGSEITFTDIDFIVENAIDPDGDSLTYIFEIDTVATFDSPDKQVSEPMSPDGHTTHWAVIELTDDTRYYWRVKADDGGAQSRWAVGNFFINTRNNPPPFATLKNPGIDAWVNTRTPQIAVHGVADVDADDMQYHFELFADQTLSQPIGYAEEQNPVWSAMTPLQTGRRYFWRAQPVDEHGVAGQWSETGNFFVKINTIDLAPQITFLTPDQDLSIGQQELTIQWSDADPDSNALIALYFDTDGSGADGVLIAEQLEEDPDGNADTFTWDISALEGTYYIYAIIADGNTTETIYAPAAITIDHTPPTVTVDPPGGTYADGVEITLTADEPSQIYYTLDGSEPDMDSNQYTSPFILSEDGHLKCMAVDAAGNQSPTVSQSYTFGATDITVTLSTDKGRALDNVRIYAFTDAGGYTGKYGTSDDNGLIHFNPDDFSPGDYKFRVDYLGQRIWSDTVMLPDTRAIDVFIAEEPVTITVDTASGAVEGVRVYLFSADGRYLGQYLTTDANGQVIFDLPSGFDFTFRADLCGNQYWSSVTTVQSGAGNAVPVDAGGGRLGVEIIKSANAPITGIRVYLFNIAGSYLGRYGTTDANGQVDFDVPAGDYKVRADYLGSRFWSADTTVTTDTQLTMTIPHQQLQVTVESLFQQVGDPLENVRVYLFTGTGSYLGQYATTDNQGRVYFELPEKVYKVRADFMGQKFWSAEFTWQDPVVSVPMADVDVSVTGGGSPLENVRVYLFSAAGSYLGQYAETDGTGLVRFRVPEGAYKFRADYQGNRFWSTVENLAADQLHQVGISTGGGSFDFTLWSGPNQLLGNVKCYVFDESNHYLGLYGTTAANGLVNFDLADGTYMIRADYLGHQFWSDVIQVPDTLSGELTISHTPVAVNVISAGQNAPDVRVYLFSGDGAYLGEFQETDANGIASFDLPAGIEFLFRADLNGHQYWSDLFIVPQTAPAQVIIDAGGGRWQLTIDDGNGNAIPGLKVYLFSQNTAYLGRYLVTDTDGVVAFDLSGGIYKLRVDYLGYHFWTDETLVDQDMATFLTLDHQDVDISVQGRSQGIDTPLAGVKAYLFTPTGSYLGQYQVTGADGRISFSLPQQDYQVRVDYMGRQYWSQSINQQNTAVTIPMADARVTITGAGLPQEAINVYLFSENDAYLGSNAQTDANGQVSFRLPAGSYRFRADYLGNQYWSATQPLVADQSNDVIVSVGGGTFTLNVLGESGSAITGVHGYVFNSSGAYIGLSGATDDQGRLFWDLADGTFKFRVDYLGYQYWSEPVTIPSALETSMAISHQAVTLSLSGKYINNNDPLAGIRLYLFSAAGSYMGIYHTTDNNGRADFILPDQDYKVRADYLGDQYWSAIFRSQNTAVEIAQGAVDLHVHRSGTNVEGARVYLFNADGRYLERYEVTDTDGMAAFTLPEGHYRFRADADGVQRWRQDVTVTADQSTAVDMDMDQ